MLSGPPNHETFSTIGTGWCLETMGHSEKVSTLDLLVILSQLLTPTVGT